MQFLIFHLVGFEQHYIFFAKYNLENIHTGGWNGYKELVVTKKVKESNEITSFYFNTVNGEPLPKFKPGQFLSLRLPKGTFSSIGEDMP